MWAQKTDWNLALTTDGTRWGLRAKGYPQPGLRIASEVSGVSQLTFQMGSEKEILQCSF